MAAPLMKRSEMSDVPEYCKDYLVYLQTVRSLSPLTVKEYYLDLKSYFRYLKLRREQLPEEEFHALDASDVSLDEFAAVKIDTLYDFQAFRMSELGNSARSRSRKISSLRGIYKYLISQKRITDNPTVDLRFPKTEKTLPHYLSFDQSLALLSSIDGRFQMRNLAIVTLFLNCGIRLSELVGLNYNSISDRHMRVLGKGNKERILFLNDSCLAALEKYKEERAGYTFRIIDRDALFVSQRGTRISPRMVQVMVKEFMQRCGIDTAVYSVHKLRHTAATLMYQNGVDVRILQEILGHSNLGTTQIYTHIKNAQIEEAMSTLSLSAQPGSSHNDPEDG